MSFFLKKPKKEKETRREKQVFHHSQLQTKGKHTLRCKLKFLRFLSCTFATEMEEA
jgi:hypothetical protein